ncbi:MAG: hypothetical protein JWO14_1663 [Solirubrobacterales bacterium]|nr:hypothetical protein [Solirubrobacterales bacterium]
MRSTVLRTGPSILLVAVLAMLGLGAATAPCSSAAAKPAHGPVIVVKTVHQARGTVVLHVKARRDLRSAVVQLDGHRVESELPLERGQQRAIVLDHGDGVRFGRNRITVKARTRNGGRALVRDVVTVRRDAPLPAIRQPRRIVASHAARLDGRKTRSAHGGKLGFRWRVVGAPVGSRVSLRGAESRRPRLLASDPGDYRVALTVTESGAKTRGTAASASSSAPDCAVSGSTQSGQAVNPGSGPIASMPLNQLPKGALTIVDSRNAASPEGGPQPQAVPGCATTVTDVEVKPNFEPIGVAIDTRAEVEETAGIRIGASFYPFPVNGEGGARFVLLDAGTLELIRTENVALNGSHIEIAQKMAAESAPGRNVLVVSSCRYANCNTDPVDARTGFSAIESYGPGRRGPRTENQGIALGAINESENQRYGELAGWLRPGVSLDGGKEYFGFVNPERFAFDTEASGTSFSNTIRVGTTEYPASVSGAVGGFEVLVLGPDLEPELGTPVAFSTISTTGEGQAQEEAMTALLNRTSSLQTVIVQSIGDAQPDSGAATALGQALARLGASPWTFLSLNGSGGYAFVGNGANPQVVEPGHVEPEVAETSEELSHGGDGSLHGLLTRNPESALSPDLADAIGTPNYELDQVTYQPGVPWPQTNTEGKVAAIQYLAEALGLTPGEGSCYRPAEPDFRSSYCDLSLDIDATENELERQKYPAGENVSFTQAEFEAVQSELETELDDVADVRKMVGALKEPLGGQSPAVDAQQIAGEVLDALPPGSGSGNATAGKLSLASAILHAGSNIPTVGEGLGAIASVLGLAGELEQENGEYSPDWQIQAAADEIGGKVKSRLTAMSAGLGAIEEILVTDWGKLSAAAAGAAGPWGINATGIQQQSSAIELGINQWMWKAILPAAFELVAFPGAQPGVQEGLYCMTNKVYPTEWHPWRGAPSSSVFFPLVSFERGKLMASGAYGMLDGSFTKKSSKQVSSGLAEKIFGPPGQGAALTAPELFEDSHWTIAHPGMIETEEEEKVGNCGW